MWWFGFGFKERGAKIGGDLKQIGGKPSPFALPSDVFGPCGGSGKSDLRWKIDHGKQPLVHLGCACCSVVAGFVAKFWEYFVEVLGFTFWVI